MWDLITILPAEGMSLQLKKLCTEYNKNCNNYLECTAICDKISDVILNLLQQNLWNYVKKRGPDVDGEYPFIKLFNFIKREAN